MYKLIAIDIDDTLLNDNVEISDRVRSAIQKAVEKGAKVVLCTGRHDKRSGKVLQRARAGHAFHNGRRSGNIRF